MKTDAGVVANSATIAGWTMVSRATGFIRVAVVAAVLGPTFFGNLYQTTNSIPNVMYEFLTGALFASLLVPSLVRHVDLIDSRAQRRLVDGFLGVVCVGYGVVVLLISLTAPLVIRLLTVGVQSAEIRAAEQRAGVVLLLLVMPQVMLYGLIGTAVAAQNAAGRFALAAAAPALENLGVIATLAFSWRTFGAVRDIRVVSGAQILFLGIGSTAAVAVHAACQWVGAARVGMPLVPRAGWRDAEVRRIVRLGIPSLGFAAFATLRYGAIFVVTGSVAGGVVAFQIALTFYYLVVALGARPVAAAVLPRLSRNRLADDLAGFDTHYRDAVSLITFVTVPASFALVGLAQPIATAISFGGMATGRGPRLVTLSLITMGVGVIGEAIFVLATQALYACHDARTPLGAMALRTALLLAGFTLAITCVRGAAVLVLCGISISVADLTGGYWLDRRLRSILPGRSGGGIVTLLRTSAAAAAAVLLARLISSLVMAAAPGATGAFVGLGAGAMLAIPAYVVLQHAGGSPVAGAMRTRLVALRRRPC